MRTILNFILMVIPFVFETGCTENEVSEIVTARILKPTCGGTVMQIINGSLKGEEWKFFANLEGPFDSSSPAATYENAVLVGNVPLDRRVIGDTLQFSYIQGLTDGNYCEIGGLPKLTISVETLKN
ncbi:hypothetical protein [Dyadobacter sp. OTU695]|uniref:hypothetical protein n=1 Tax=Dyadobacter sp. OTU695 TaxID=3043860 RepID=UPI00313C1B7F